MRVRFDSGVPLAVGKGAWLLLPPWLRRAQQFSKRARILSIAFTLPMPEGWRARTALPLRVPSTRAPRLFEEAVRLQQPLQPDERYHPQSERMHSVAQWLELHARLTEFAAVWARVVGLELLPAADAEARVDPRLRKACRLLEAYARIGPVPYSELRAATGLSAVQLNRLFRSELGTSPKTELNRLCQRLAIARLSDPRLAVKTIAYDLGFTDSSHFCKWFARQTGKSPANYRLGLSV